MDIAARWQELGPLLDRVLDLPPIGREAFLQDEVADTQLRAMLRALLERAEEPGFLDGDSGAYAARLLAVDSIALPATIGPYRILRLLGEGGSGSVFLAERDADGYVQRVALKLLRVGLRDPLEQERFRRERRILARLEHPAIARLLDGGFSGEGVPWFALEYVEGEIITVSCDRRHLDLTARLQLFMAVCAAVEAAHRALIVHRDLKPANILVNVEGLPKLLDFGIARLLDDSETEQTRTGARRLTPAYAAPEQFDGGLITTATDVYALGALLHELLSGVRAPRADAVSWRCCSALYATAADAELLARSRGTSAARLGKRLRGDIDTILSTALAANPAERYVSVAALADDVRRHLAQRPIAARRASALHRAGRFLQRHRFAGIAAALFISSSLLGIAATLRASGEAQRAAVRAQEQAERAETVKDFVLALFAGVTPDESRGREIGARELIERGEARLAETLATHADLRAELSAVLASAYRQLGAYDRAAVLAQAALAAAPGGELRATAMTELARIEAAQAHYADAEAHLRAVLASTDAPLAQAEARSRLAELLAESGKPEAALALLDAVASVTVDTSTNPQLKLRDIATRGRVRFVAGDLAGAEIDLRAALAAALSLRGEQHTETARIEHDLGVVLLQRGASADARDLLQRAVLTRRSLLGARHPDLAQSVFNLAIARQRLGDNAGAAELYADALVQQRAVLGPNHPDVASTLNSMALLAWQQGDAETAILRLREALAVARIAHGEQHPSVATMLGNLAGFERAAGQLEAAARDQRDALTIAIAALGPRHYLAGVAQIGLAAVHAEAGRDAEALLDHAAGLAVLDASLGAGHADTAQARAGYADLLRNNGQLDKAAIEAKAALEAISASLPDSHPRRLRIELAMLRSLPAAQMCARLVERYSALAAGLAQGGTTMRYDRIAAALLVARCLRSSDANRAAAALAEADALLQSLPFVPRRLRRERADG